MKKKSNLYNHLETAYSTSIEDLINKLKKEISSVVSSYPLIKKNGEIREIHQVSKNSLAWSVQRFLINHYFSKIFFPESVYGYQKGRSYFGFLEHHTSDSQSYSFIKLDIKDFFGSIDVDRLMISLATEFESNPIKRVELKKLFIVVLTFKKKVPQGFQTSPFLSNYFFLRADIRIQKYCNKLNYKYSRYADDMILSSSDKNKLMSNNTIPMIRNILNDFELKLNREKTKTSQSELALNGFVISSEIRLSQKKLKELRRVIFVINQCKKSENIILKLNSTKNTNSMNKKRRFTKRYLLNYLSGNRSFLISSLKKANPSGAWYTTASKLIKGIEESILKIF